jgi:radical SAM protein with 4Fe4S-binding SPASM domain
MCAQLGVQRIFGTRLVPSVNVEDPACSEFHLGKETAMKVLDSLIDAREDFGIAVGSLIGYPLCLLSDLEKYADFVGRGCPAQRGNRMIINADGSTHACTHESRSYGNVFEVGIAAAFQKMHQWHDGSYLNPDCDGCAYIRVCRSGCRAAAYAYERRMDGKDPLSNDFKSIKTPYYLEFQDEITQALDQGISLEVSQHIRFRKENGFYVANIRWANAINVNNKIAEFLLEKKSFKQSFFLGEFRTVGTRIDLLHLLYKEVVLPMDATLQGAIEAATKTGCSIDPEDLPVLELI